MKNYKDIVKAARKKLGVTVKGQYSSNKNSETFFINNNNASWMRRVCGSRLWVGFHPEKGNFYGKKFAVALWCLTTIYQPEKEQ